jgi:putative sterol carrier protein
LHHEKFKPSTFEAKFTLGEVAGLVQSTPSVTDAAPLLAAFKSNNIVVLRNHGVVAMGQTLFDCFLFIQTLEEQVKIDAIARLFSESTVTKGQSSVTGVHEHRGAGVPARKYKLFAQDQIDEIVRLVNADPQLKELGAKTQMNMDLAVQLNETGAVYSFKFNNGQIVGVGRDENAEFLISAPENVWRAVFNREIDPFVATTQKKMNLRGDFARISKWYAPCSRIFQLWAEVPVE